MNSVTKAYISNAFSLSMLDLQPFERVNVKVREVDHKHWADLVRLCIRKEDVDVECVIGHESTAKLARDVINLDANPVELECGRKAIRLRPGDLLLVIQPKVRLPEGKVLNYDEIKELLREGKIGFYTVYYAGREGMQ